MDILIGFLVSVAAGVAANCICKRLDRNASDQNDRKGQ